MRGPARCQPGPTAVTATTAAAGGTMAEQGRAIDAVKEIIYQCNRCAHCFDLSWLGDWNKCPAYRWGRFESFTGRGRFFMARALVDGQLDYSADMAGRVFACTECRAC